MMKTILTAGVVVLVSAVGSHAHSRGVNPYCCGKYENFMDKLSPNYPNDMMDYVKDMNGNYFNPQNVVGDGQELIRLSPRVGFCSNATTYDLESAGESMMCTPLCCDCCHDMLIRDTCGEGVFKPEGGADPKVLPDRDLHLCCKNDKCYLQSGQDAALEVTPDLTDLIAAVNAALTDLEDKCVTNFDEADECIQGARVPAISAIEALQLALSKCAKGELLDEHVTALGDGCGTANQIGSCTTAIGNVIPVLTQLAEDGCFGNPLTVYCERRSKCDCKD